MRKRAVSVELYTRRGCHLCDEAKRVLVEAGLEPREIDIDRDAELQSRYGEQIPVVVIEGKERFRGRVEPVLLSRLLKALEDDHRGWPGDRGEA